MSSSAPSEAELSAAECLQRSREKKKRRLDMLNLVSTKGSIQFTKDFIENNPCSDLAKCVLQKMLATGIIDDGINPIVIECVAQHADDLFKVSSHVRDGNGFDLIKGVIDPDKYAVILVAFKANYSSITDADAKCMFWAICAVLLIMNYELNSDAIFDIPMSYTEAEFEDFLNRYPEFLIRTWDAASLMEFYLCMKWAVKCFGNGNNMGCLVELVTRIMKGRHVALTCNTSGGGLKNYDQPTEVSTEKCRILIYQRESGIVPRTRKSRGAKRKYQHTGPIPATMPLIPGINAPRNAVAYYSQEDARMYRQEYDARAQQGGFYAQHVPDMAYQQAAMYSNDMGMGGLYSFPNGVYGQPPGHHQGMHPPPSYGGYDAMGYQSTPPFDPRVQGMYGQMSYPSDYSYMQQEVYMHQAHMAMAPPGIHMPPPAGYDGNGGGKAHPGSYNVYDSSRMGYGPR